MTETPRAKYNGPGNPTHGKASTYRSPRYKCRCQPCTDANAAQQAQVTRRRAQRVSDNPNIVKHGLESTYTNYDCRCPKCLIAGSNRNRRSFTDRKKRLAADPTIRAHGLESTYVNWGCRCDQCRTGNKTATAERRGNQ